MKKLLTVTAIVAGSLLGGSAWADHGPDRQSYLDTAEVISATPVYRTIHISTPHRECWQEKRHGKRHHHQAHNSYTAPIAGAIVGGVIGNQFGRGSGKDVLTIGGALLGASIGNDVRNTHGPAHRHGPRYQRHCETVRTHETREEADGYRVTYRYQGEVFHTHMDYHPGATIEVRVNVQPLG